MRACRQAAFDRLRALGRGIHGSSHAQGICHREGAPRLRSERPSAGIEAIGGGMYTLTYALGNLFFDQRGSRGSGALLEVRFFRQGTFAMRLVPVPNLFDLGSELLRRADDLKGGFPN